MRCKKKSRESPTAATNNSAGYGDLTPPARQENRRRPTRQQAQQNQVTFANQQLKEQLAGLKRPRARPKMSTPTYLGKAMGVRRSC